MMVGFLLSGLPVILAADLTIVKFHAVLFDPPETTAPAFFIGGGKATRKPLGLDKSRLSEIQEAAVRPGRMVDFFLTKTPLPEEKPAVTIMLPEAFSGLQLLVFAPSGTGYQAWSIPLPPDDFPPGGTLLANLAPVELAVRLGTATAIRVMPSTHQFLRIPTGFKEDMIPIQIHQKASAGEAWQVVQSTRWAVDFRFRSYVFFYQPANGRLLLHGITERMD